MADLKLDANGEVRVGLIEVPGIVRDDYGNEWAIPADDASYADLLSNPLSLPKQDPKFHYQFIRQDQVTSAATYGFRPVRREEVGIDSVVTQADFGGPQVDYHQVHDLVLMKMPLELAKRRYKAADKAARDAVAQIGDPDAVAAAGGRRQGRQMTQSIEPDETIPVQGATTFEEPKL